MTRILSSSLTLMMLVVIGNGTTVPLSAEEKPPKVEEIRITGNVSIKEGALRGAMLTRESRWWNRSRIQMDLFRDDLHSIVTYYQNHGYLDAGIASWDTVHLKKNRIRIRIEVTEGPQFTIDSLTFRGNTIFTDEELEQRVQISPGKRFSYNEMIDSNWKIVNSYAERGFLDAQVRPDITISQPTVDIMYRIDEGLPTYADSITITGNSKTRPRVIRRNLEFARGELLTRNRMVSSQQNLYKTGLFQSVNIQTIEDTVRRSYRPVVVRVNEAKGGEFNFGVGYGSHELFRVSAEIRQANLAGTGQRVALQTKLSSRGFTIEGRYSAPYLITQGSRLDNTTYLRQERENTYTVNRLGTELEIGQQLTRASRISSSVRIENNYFAEFDPEAVTDTLTGRLRTLRLGFTRDSRENLFNASTGSYFQWKVEMAGGFLSGTDRFVRTTIDYTKYVPLTEWMQFAFHHSSGLIREYGTRKNIPIYERFYAGGDRTIRGFEERSVGPSRNTKPVGGRALLIFRGETRIPLYKKFHAALFLDTGDVWNRFGQISAGSFRTGAGIGLRYNSPLGVVRFDAGFKLHRAPEESAYQLHLTVGQAL